MTVVLVRTSRARRFRRDAAASDQREIIVDIVAVARVVLRVDDLEVAPRPDLQAKALGAARDHLRAADQDRRREPFLEDDLRGAQHALVLALGVDDALPLRLRGRDDRRMISPERSTKLFSRS